MAKPNTGQSMRTSFLATGDKVLEARRGHGLGPRPHTNLVRRRYRGKSQAGRGKFQKVSPGDFYFRTSSRSTPTENAEDALMCWSTCLICFRYIDDGHTRGWSTKHEFLIKVSNRDQIWSQTKCRKQAKDRSFEIMGVAENPPPQSIARWILIELHDDQMSVSRITEVWPSRPQPNQALGQAKVIVVLLIDSAK